MNGIGLDEVLFTFLDVETTGLNPAVRGGDRICEIGLLRCRGGEELAAYHTLINPGRPITAGAQAVNHITDDMVADAPPFSGIVKKALAFLEDAVLVAHNAPFDMSFLNLQLSILRMPELKNTVVDTLPLVRSLYRFPSNSLGSLRRYMGLDVRAEHRAMEDVRTLRGVFMHMVTELKGRGVETLEQLRQVQEKGSLGFYRGAVILPPEIEEAVRKAEDVRIRYVSAGGLYTERVIRPREVEVRGGSVYLVAYCYMRREERSFRLDRIVEMTSLT